METATKMLVGARENVVRKLRGQTITEYSLMFASIALLTYGFYATIGNSIGSLASDVGSTMADACRSVLRHL